jgi:hypothetical protein
MTPFSTMTPSMKGLYVILNLVTFSINDTLHYNTATMLSVLFFTMLNAIMLIVLMLSVVVPFHLNVCSTLYHIFL